MSVSVKPPLSQVIDEITDGIRDQMEGRCVEASNELRNAALKVLSGQRGGRRYKVPGTYRRQRDKATGKMKNGRYYTASAPGEPPAVRTGAFRSSWQPKSVCAFGSYISRIETNLTTPDGKYVLGEILEYGTSRMAARPHQDRILEKAEDPILAIYSRPYF